MHEQEKLKEAKHFYSRMKEEQGQEDRESFKYNLSAFLSAARSVLQYALKEVDPGENPKAVPGAKAWYDNFVANSPVLKFFKDKRDINIHDEPIDPRADIAVTITEQLHLSESIVVVVRDKDGKIKSQFSSEEPKPKPKRPKSSVESKTTFRFNDWTGNEDVITLCERYIQELEKAVKDGMSKGYITG